MIILALGKIMLRRLNRRSFLSRIVGASAIGGGALSLVLGKSFAQAPQPRTCLTDTDSSDRPDFGTRTGLTDRDSQDAVGRGTLTQHTDADTHDLANRGRSWRCPAPQQTGITDHDTGANADRAGYGRTGVTDNDSGPNADRPGYGRGGSAGGASDNDSGPGADPAGRGRGSNRMGASDSDATDSMGHGRGRGNATGYSDSDPTDSAGQGRGQHHGGESYNGGSGASDEPPNFPMPIPTPTIAPFKLPHNGILATLGVDKSLYAVGQHLTDALNRVGYSQYSFYNFPHGFALVSRLERINDDGRPAADAFRYMPSNQTDFSLTEYLSGLFVAPVGHYRQIVFIVTDLPVVANGAPLSENGASRVLHGGASGLSARLRTIPFSANHDVIALIYEFQKTGRVGQMRQMDASPLSAQAHLVRSGLYTALMSQ